MNIMTCRAEISKEEARSYLVNYHNLNRAGRFEAKEGILKCFERIKSIQYDPLDVVGRNPDLVLQARVRGYKPEMLYELLYHQHELIDGVDKEMCIYATKEFTSFERIRSSCGESAKRTLSYRGQSAALDILDEIRAHIRLHGSTGSKDISIGESYAGRWGHKKLSSAALDYLYSIGELCVKDKKGVQKYYDFTENVISSQYLNKEGIINEEDFLDWYVNRRIKCTGFLWKKRGAAWLGHYIYDNAKREQALNRLVEKNKLKTINIEGINTPFYYPAEAECFFNSFGDKDYVRFLAPLDNMLWDRELVRKIFDFDYSWEVYTPVTKRKYGYYVLPVLYGTSLIARFEPEKRKKGEPFAIKKWWWEPGVSVTDEMLMYIQKAIEDFAAYLSVPCKDSYVREITE